MALGHQNHCDDIIGIIDGVLGPQELETRETITQRRIGELFDDLWRQAREAGWTDLEPEPEVGVTHERAFLHIGDDRLRSIMLLHHVSIDNEGAVVETNDSIFVLDPDLGKAIYEHGTDQIVFRFRDGHSGVMPHNYVDTGTGLKTEDEELPQDLSGLEKLATTLELAEPAYFHRAISRLSTAA